MASVICVLAGGRVGFAVDMDHNTFDGSCRHSYDTSLSDFKTDICSAMKLLISSTNSSGLSIAGKCPPCVCSVNSFQYFI